MILASKSIPPIKSTNMANLNTDNPFKTQLFAVLKF